MTDKIKNYILALYLSGAVGLADVGYFGYHCFKDKDITKKTAIVAVGGFGLYTVLWGIGVRGMILEDKIKKNGYEENEFK